MTDNQKQDEQELIQEEENSNEDADLDLDMAKGKIIKLKERIKKCSKEKEEYLDGWQRAKAEMINYRRRQEEQSAEWLKMAQAGLIKDLLPMLDTLEAGFKNYDLRFKNEENIKVKPIRDQLLDILKKYGLEEIETTGEKFNPEFHEAIEVAEDENREDGIIVEEIQKGYLLNGKVLRTSKVKVTKKI